MQLRRILQVLPLVASATAFGLRRDESGEPLEGVELTKQFIIEVNSVADVDTISKKLTKGKSARVLKTFKSDVFTGIAIETDDDNIDTINEASEVAQAWAATLLHVPELESQSALADLSDAANYTVHETTGVAKVHALGNYGQGVKIAIVDTGVDYTHEALGGGFGPGFKVSGGYDHVGDTWNADRFNAIPDEDPMDQRGHGTHVAGIIGGKADWFTGVAPEAELLAYKVFATRGSTWDIYIIEAFLRAYEDGADVITASIGGAYGGGWSNGAWATIASRIVDSGVIVTIAAGNDGDMGPFYANSGSSGKGVVAVGASAASTWIPSGAFDLSITKNGEAKTTKQAIQWFSAWAHVDAPIVPLFSDFDTENQGCTPDDIPADTSDLTGKIVMVRQSSCQTEGLVLALRTYNPLAILFVSNGGRPNFPASRVAYPLALVEARVGEAIVEAVAAGEVVTASFDKYHDEFLTIGIENPAALPMYFTTWGGLYDLDTKPDIAAPGAEIMSLALDNKWRTNSGTSMACPYVAGVAALFLHANGGRDVSGSGVAHDFYRRLTAGGNTMPWSTLDHANAPTPDIWSPTIQTGSGLVDAWKIVNSTTRLDTTRFLLNDTANFQGEQSVEITNTANVDVQYTFQLQPAGGLYAGVASGPGLVRLAGIQPVSMVPDFESPSGTFTVRPGETKKATFTFDYPRGLNVARQPFYSGKVLVGSSVGESLSIVYFGAAFDLKAHYQKIFAEPPKMSTTSTSFNLDTLDYLRLFVSFHWGCDELRFDLYESGWTNARWSYPPVAGEGGYVGAATSWRHSSIIDSAAEFIDTADDTISFPLRSFSRDLIIYSGIGYTTHRFFWFGKMADGSKLAPGSYTIRLAALRPFGVRENAEDWDVHLVPFTVKP